MGTRIWIVLIFLPSLCVANYSEIINYNNDGVIDSDWFRAMIHVESSGNPKASRKEKDGDYSYGLMQIKLSTARDMGFGDQPLALLLPDTNIKFGIRYFYWLYERYSNWTNRLLVATDAYNRGIGNVERWKYIGKWSEHKYVSMVLKKYKEIKDGI